MKRRVHLWTFLCVGLVFTPALSQNNRVLPPVVSGSQSVTQQPILQQNSQVGNLYVQNSQMQEEIRALTGRIEELQFQLRELQQTYDNKIGDVEFRLNELEEIIRSATQSGTEEYGTEEEEPQTEEESVPEEINGGLREDEKAAEQPQNRVSEETKKSTTGVLGAISADANASITEYNSALEKLRAGQYQDAQSAFQQYLQKYPNSTMTPEAYYMLGEAFYSQGSYKDAAENFLSGFQKFPEDVKAPENLLKLGMSLARLGQAQEACLTYQRLLSQYNNAPEYTINLATIELERVGCQI